MANFSKVGKYSGRLHARKPKALPAASLLDACKIEEPPPEPPSVLEERKRKRRTALATPLVNWICQCTREEADALSYGAWDATLAFIMSAPGTEEDIARICTQLHCSREKHDRALKYWPEAKGEAVIDLATGHEREIAEELVCFYTQHDCKFPKNNAAIWLQDVCRLTLGGKYLAMYCGKRRAELGGVFTYGLGVLTLCKEGA